MELGSLTRAQRRAYDETTAGSHEREVTVLLLRRDGTVVRSFVNEHLGGAIHGDTSRTPVEVCEIDLFDPDFTLSWARGEHRRYDLRVIDARFVPALNDWVEETVFTGPLWDFDRVGAVMSLVAQGSERKAMGSVRNTYTAPRKSRATRVARDLLMEAGATDADLSIPTLDAALPERVTVGVKRGKDQNEKKPGHQGKRRQIFRATTEDTYYGEYRQIADALDRDAFCDGLGRFLMRSPRTRPSLALTEDTLLAEPVAKRVEDGEPFNTWLVIGADPKGPRKRIEVEVGLPKRHPESAHSQRWNGKPRKIIERIENSKLRSREAARKVGVRRRDRALRDATTLEISALPVIPWVRPDMLVSVPSGQGRTTSRVTKWTLPLGPDADPLTLGANRKRRWEA